MKAQLTTAIKVVNDNSSGELFNQVITFRQDLLDVFAFTFDNLNQREVNYEVAEAGPLSVKTLLGISDFTKVVGINIFLRQKNADDTTETQPKQFAYSITTAAGDVPLGSISQLQLMGLANNEITDITVSTIPLVSGETLILSLIAFITA